ncbi:hypothetical protein ABT294_30990 [Nonomuraea sp. NPDC000554]|uniref:hypothetical protein n=1 Tax=Nonomuraea sp. NPDC000554 TaxID=3154259 RepID=UPI00332305B6
MRGSADGHPGLLMAVAAPVAGLGLAVVTKIVAADPPGWLDNWAGGLLQVVAMLAALALALFTGLYFHQVIIFLGSSIALSIALFAATDAVDAWVLTERGQTTPCTIVRVDMRQETHTTTNADGTTSTTTSTSYDHTLTCAQRQVTAMTTDSPAGKAGERIAVAFDPQGRINPKPADSAYDFTGALWRCCVGAVVGIGLRVFYVARRTRRLRGANRPG